MTVRGSGGNAEAGARVTLTGQLLGGAKDVSKYIDQLTVSLKAFTTAMSSADAAAVGAGGIANLGKHLQRSQFGGGVINQFMQGYSQSLPRFSKDPALLNQYQQQAHQIFNGIANAPLGQTRGLMYNDYISQARYLFNPASPGMHKGVGLRSNEQLQFQGGHYYVWNKDTDFRSPLGGYLKARIPNVAERGAIKDYTFNDSSNLTRTFDTYAQAKSGGGLTDANVAAFRTQARLAEQAIQQQTELIRINTEKSAAAKQAAVAERKRTKLIEQINAVSQKELNLKSQTVKELETTLALTKANNARMTSLDKQILANKAKMAQEFGRVERMLYHQMGLTPLDGNLRRDGSVMPSQLRWQPRGIMERMAYGNQMIFSGRTAGLVGGMTGDMKFQSSTRSQMIQRMATYQQLAAAGMGHQKIQQTLSSSAESAALFNQHLSRTNDILGRTAVAMTVFYGIAQGLRSIVTSTRELESIYARISGITGGAFSGQGGASSRMGMRQSMSQLSRETGIHQFELAKSLEIGFQAADMPSSQAAFVARMGTQLAVGSGTPVQPIMNTLMAAKNAYRLNNEQLTQFGRGLARSRAEGVIEFSEIETGIGKVFQTSRLAGFRGLEGLDQVMAMVAAVTKEAGNPSLNMTMLARTFSEISKPKTVQKLAGYGIGYDRENPMQTIMDITSYGGSSESAMEFIQSSGIFGRELGRRGLATLASQRKYWLPRIEGTSPSSGTDFMTSAFESAMDTEEARMKRVQALVADFALTIGRDLTKAIDNAYKPLLGLVAIMEKIPSGLGIQGESPGLAIGSGLISGMGTALTLGLMATAGAKTIGTLTGLTVPGRRGAGMAGGLGDSMLGLLTGAMMPGFYEGMNERNAQYNKVFADTQEGRQRYIDKYRRNIGGRQLSMRQARLAAGRKIAGLRRTPGMGLQMGMAGALRIGATAMVLGFAQNRWEEYQDSRMIPYQDAYETALQNVRDIPEQFAPTSQALSTARDDPNAQNIKNLAVEWAAFTATIGGSLPKYESIIGLTNEWIDSNGKLRESFDSITKSIYDMTEAEIRREMSDVIKKQTEIANKLTEATMSKQLPGMAFVQGIAELNAGTGINRAKGKEQTLANFLANLIGGGESFYVTDKERKEFTGSTDYSEFSDTAAFLASWLGDPKEFDRITEQLKKELELTVEEEKRLKEQLQELVDTRSSEEIIADESAKVQEKIYDQAKELLEGIKYEVAEVEKRAELEGKMNKLSDEAISRKKEEGVRSLLVNKYLDLIGLDIKHVSELIPEFEAIFKDEITAMEGAVQNTEKLNSSLEGVALAALSYERYMNDLSDSAERAALRNERNIFGIEQNQLGRESYYSTSNQAIDILQGFIPGPAGEVAGLMLQGRMREQQFKLSAARAKDQVGISRLQRQSVSNEALVMEASYGGELSKLEEKLANATSETDKAALRGKITSLKQRRSREVTTFKFQGEKLVAEQEFGVMQGLAGSSLELLAQLSDVRQMFGGDNEFDPRFMHEIDTVIKAFGQFEIARDPGGFFKGLMGMDLEGISNPAKQVIKPLQQLGKIWFDSGSQKWGDFMGLPGVAGHINTLSGLAGAEYEDIMSKDISDTIASFEEQLKAISREIVPDIRGEFENTRTALEELVIAINGLRDTFNLLSGTPSGVPGIPTTQEATSASTAAAAYSWSIPSGAKTQAGYGKGLVDYAKANQASILNSARINMMDAGQAGKAALIEDVKDTCVAFTVQALREVFNYDVGQIASGGVLDTKLDEMGWSRLTRDYQPGDILRSTKGSLHTGVFAGYNPDGTIQSIENQGLQNRAADYWEYGWSLPPIPYDTGKHTQAAARNLAGVPVTPGIIDSSVAVDGLDTTVIDQDNTDAVVDNSAETRSLSGVMSFVGTAVLEGLNSLGAMIASITGTEFTPFTIPESGGIPGTQYGGAGIGGTYQKYSYRRSTPEVGYFKECTDPDG